MFNRKKYLFLLQPLVAAFIFSAIFFALVFIFFRPGYGATDDINIISIAFGYLGGKPLPFLVYSNVLLGFALNFFYGVSPHINWEICFFIALNFLSVWALIYVFSSRLPEARLKLFATLSILLADAYFVINLTFTLMAAFSTLAGFCLLLMAIQTRPALKKGAFVFGIALALAGSLIRLKAMLLVCILISPALLFFYPLLQRKKLILAFITLGILVSGGYFFDRLYVQSNPDWSSYQTYDSVRSQIHDTPRNLNIKNKPADASINPVVAQVGWSKNDLKVFLNWFFPDKQIYSLENLQYIVEHVPGEQATRLRAISILSTALLRPVVLPYFLIVFSTWVLMLFYGFTRRAAASLLTLLATFGGLAFYLAWAMKIPDRVLMILLAGTAIWGLYSLTLSLSGTDDAKNTYQRHKNPIGWFVAAVCMAVVFGLVLNQSLVMTKVYVSRQDAYQKVQVDLKNLQGSGKISQNALIISPSGFPFEWANPLTVDFPAIHILDLGWLTFSPTYERVLREFDVQSVPEALYAQKNVYLMAPSGALPAILVFIQEHQGFKMEVSVIYQIPGTDIELCKLNKGN
jgi:hypothetical protein